MSSRGTSSVGTNIERLHIERLHIKHLLNKNVEISKLKLCYHLCPFIISFECGIFRYAINTVIASETNISFV